MIDTYQLPAPPNHPEYTDANKRELVRQSRELLRKTQQGLHETIIERYWRLRDEAEEME